MEEFEKLAAIELDEPELAGQEEAGEAKSADNPEFEFDRNGAEDGADETAATAASPDPAEMAATPAESTSAEDTPAAPSPNEQAE